MLYNVQVLRAVAALLVVHAHAASITALDLRWSGGATGVDLFFVISGFIIAYVASLDTHEFLARRLIRIVPIYWISTLVVFTLVKVIPAYFRTTSPDPVLLVRSLLFLPTGWNVHTSDGIPHPTLSGGWTLNYEMYFYVVYAISLAISKRRATVIAIGVLLGVIALVHATSLADHPATAFYGNPIVLEFVFGMLAFHLIEALGKPDVVPAGLVAKLILAVTIALGFVLLAFSEEVFGEAPRWLVSGIPGFAILVSAVLLERRYGLRVTNRVAVMVGDASYVLYLIHVYVVLGVIRLVIGHRTMSEGVGQLITVVLMIVSAAAAVAIYRYFEQPILRMLKRRLLAPTIKSTRRA